MRCRDSKVRSMNARRGVASLEFVMGLPLILIVFIFVLIGARLFVVRANLAQQPRMSTYPQRHGTPSSNLLDKASASEMGKPFRRPSNGGLISETHSVGITMPRQLGGYGLTLKETSAVLGGAWDWQTLPYSPRQPLQVNPLLSVYGKAGAADVRGLCDGLARLGR